MTVKRYCDICEAELERNYVGDRLKGQTFMSGPHRGTHIGVEVMLQVDGTWNAGELCGDCAMEALDAVYRGVENRAREKQDATP